MFVKPTWVSIIDDVHAVADGFSCRDEMIEWLNDAHDGKLKADRGVLIMLQSEMTDRDNIKKNVKLFLMSRYVVCSGDQYRLNGDDHKRLDEILDGRELRDDEDPYKIKGNHSKE